MSPLEPLPLTLSGPLSEPVIFVNGQARFRVLYASEGDDNQGHTAQDHEVNETVLPCVVSDPVLAAPLADLKPGTMLHLTGFLAVPGTDGNPLRLVVRTIEFEPRLAVRFTLADSTERHDDYLAVRTLTEGGAESWHLLHSSGAYAGATSAPKQIPAAIKADKAIRGSTEA